jgi:hypothetical protein
LTDSDPGVRMEAFTKLTVFNIKIDDFEKPETRMLIIKEGMADSDLAVQNACLKFLTPSIISTSQI